MTLELIGKIAFITGGAGGVGRGIVEEFLAAQAKVVVTCLNAGDADSLRELGADVYPVIADVTDVESMASAYEYARSRFGGLDAVVACAGLGDHAPLGSITMTQFDRTFNTDVRGVLITVQGALPLLRKPGTVVIIGSTASVSPPPSMSIYGGAKAAIRAMVRAWVQDVKGDDLRLNILSPGAIDTPSLRRGLTEALGVDRVDEAVRSMAASTPLGRLGQPREIGRAAVFLSSSAASFITGIELFVDGGSAQI